ncbi:ATP-dependent DNA ligase [Bradyrhizobium sp. F1.13.1]
MALRRRKRTEIGTKAPFPGFIEPLLAEQVDRVPRGARWLHEIKYDGYRAQLHIVGEDIKVFTRRGHDWTRRFRKVAEDAIPIAASSAIIDGEIVVPGEGGKTDFSQLQNSLRGRAQNIVMVAFDLLPQRPRPSPGAAGDAQDCSQGAD